jgi:hypothetical protein
MWTLENSECRGLWGEGTTSIIAHGDRDPTRLARMRWLNSAKGLNYDHSAQYDPVVLSPSSQHRNEVEDNATGATTISIKNRSYVHTSQSSAGT